MNGPIRWRTSGRRLAVAASLCFALVAAAVFARQAVLLHAAAAETARLQAERSDQQLRLAALSRQVQALGQVNRDLQRTIERIERSLGHAGMSARRSVVVGVVPGPDNQALPDRLSALTRQSAQTRWEATRLATLAGRVLNLRRLAVIARRQMVAAIPSLNPVNGGVNAAFGWRTNPWPEFHRGLDLAADYGTPVRAAGAGSVAAAGWAAGYGKKVEIDHGNGYRTWYCHLSQIGVAVGEVVQRGQTIGAAGSTGESTGPHLHYQLMQDGVAIDPLPYLNGVPARVMASLPHDSSVH